MTRTIIEITNLREIVIEAEGASGPEESRGFNKIQVEFIDLLVI